MWQFLIEIAGLGFNITFSFFVIFLFWPKQRKLSLPFGVSSIVLFFVVAIGSYKINVSTSYTFGSLLKKVLIPTLDVPLILCVLIPLLSFILGMILSKSKIKPAGVEIEFKGFEPKMFTKKDRGWE